MAKGGRKVVDDAALERAEAAKNQLVSQYLHLGSAMKRCSVAVEAYATALNDANTNEEMLALLRAPPTGAMPSGMPGMMPFLSTKLEEEEKAAAAAAGNPISKSAASGPGKGRKKRASAEAEDEPELDENGKKKRKKRAKKEVDPNAPKRPPSAYILFQNAVRHEMKAKHPELNYSELLGKVGETWKALGDDGQATYKEAANIAMVSWKSDNADYATSKIENGDVSMAGAEDPDDAAVAAQMMQQEKASKKDKKTKEGGKAPTAAEIKRAAAAEKKQQQQPAVTSTPAAKNAPAPRPASASTKKNVPQAAAQSSESDDSEDTSDDDESE